jgi:hypothetical protein
MRIDGFGCAYHVILGQVRIEQGDIVRYASGKYKRVLKCIAKAFTQIGFAKGSHIVAVYIHGAALYIIEAAYKVNDGALAGTCGSNYSYYLTGPDTKVEIF